MDRKEVSPSPLSPPVKRLCRNAHFVIASDRRERGNPTRKVVARAKPVAISRVPSPPQADRDKASVAALPRNDIMTQPLENGGKGGFEVFSDKDVGDKKI